MKLLLFWIAEELDLYRISRPKDEQAKLMCQAAYGLADFVHVLDASEDILTSEQAARAEQSGRLHLLSVGKLFAMAQNSDELLFPLRPKHHVFEHQVDFVADSLLNPKMWAVWMDEDMMGKLRRMCEKGHAGAAASKGMLAWLMLQATHAHHAMKADLECN